MADSVKVVYEVLSSDKKKEGSSIERKEFFWDQFLKYITSAILALTVLNVSVEFLRGGGVSCFPPSDNIAISEDDLEGRMIHEFARGQTSYINNYCSRSVPKTEYFPIYILIHGLLLIVPHYVWNAVHIGDFDSFFSIAEKLDRLRDSSTGEYDTNNFDRVTKLELEYSGTRIYSFYILKLILQLGICIGSITFSAAFFQNFSFIFYCPGEETNDIICPEVITNGLPCGWPLNLTVPCVYTSLRILSLVRYADFLLLVVAAVLVMLGLGWCCVRHTEQLGYAQLAKFSFQSCLRPEHFVFPQMFSWPAYPYFQSKKSDSKAAKLIKNIWLFTHYPRLHMKHVFSPRILHDLDFLLLMLFRADSSHGQVFKDIQINRELKQLVGRDHQLLHLYINIQQELPLELSSNRVKADHAEQSADNEQSENPDAAGSSRLFKRHSDRSTTPDPNPVAVISIESTDNEEAMDDSEVDDPQTERAIEEFHSIFHTSGFNGDAERIAYERYKPHLGQIEYLEEYMKGIRNVLFWFVTNFGPHYPPAGSAPIPELRNDLALDISFGSIGYSLILARPFVKVMSVRFQPHYHNSSNEPGQLEEFYTNYVTFKLPSDLYSQSSESITGAHGLILNFLRDFPSGPGLPEPRLDFIVIGPITEESKLVSVNLLLNTLYGESRIGEDAILLAIRPLKVGSKKVRLQFFKYEPSKTLFDHHYHVSEVDPKIPQSSKHYVDGCLGIKVDCGTTPCVFEMIAYKYIGKIIEQPKVTICPTFAIPQAPIPPLVPAPAGHGPTSLSQGITQATSNEVITEGGHTSTDSPLSMDSGNFSPIDVAPSIRSGDVAPNVRTGDVAPNVRTGDVAPNRRSGDVAPNVRTGDVAPNRRSGDVAPNRRAGARPRLTSEMSMDPHTMYPTGPDKNSRPGPEDSIPLSNNQ